MLRPLANLLYRRKDPTRHWRPDPARLAVDLVQCTLCGTPVGGDYQGLAPLGPTDDARRALRGNLVWPSQGVGCFVEEGGRIGDFRIILDGYKQERPFPGKLFAAGLPLAWSHRTTEAEIVAALGEPFGRANNTWDSAQMLFYEFDAGELQLALNKNTLTLDMLECWFEPELAQEGALKTYGIDKEFPAHFRRSLSAQAQQQQQQQQ